MATITESLERSLQNCSLNHERRTSNGGGGGGEDGLIGSSSTPDENNNSSRSPPITVSDTSLEINSHLSLPYHLEQYLDLKTGEIYYINWRNGMKARDDPRTAAQYGGGFYSEEEADEEDDGSYDSEEFRSELSPCSTRDNSRSNNNYHGVEKDKENVLVVRGYKSCLMYFMVPKHVEDYSKCNG
ncbi:uncharacterized protein LOC120115818 isoform X2 [Hibiscus syriacus]|nr:uncharacterized protein LOC120115818 isoform X2 [Hibiscus syriacus]